MVVIRVGLANQAKQPLNVPSQHASGASSEPGLEMQVHIMTLTERAVDNGDGASTAATDIESDQHEDKSSFFDEVCPVTGVKR